MIQLSEKYMSYSISVNGLLFSVPSIKFWLRELKNVRLWEPLISLKVIERKPVLVRFHFTIVS